MMLSPCITEGDGCFVSGCCEKGAYQVLTRSKMRTMLSDRRFETQPMWMLMCHAHWELLRFPLLKMVYLKHGELIEVIERRDHAF